MKTEYRSPEILVIHVAESDVLTDSPIKTEEVTFPKGTKITYNP